MIVCPNWGLSLGSSVFAPAWRRSLEPWTGSRPLVSSRRVTVTSSQGTQLLSARVSQAGQIIFRRRKNPRSPTRATWAWAMLSCPSLLSSPSSKLDGSAKRSGRTSTPRCSGLHCHALKTRSWIGSSWRWPHAFHITPIRPSERQLMCGQARTRSVVFKLLGMCGKSSPSIWG